MARVIRSGSRRHQHVKAWIGVVAASAVFACMWLASSLEPFTWPARLTIGVLGLGVLALAGHAHRRRMTLHQWWLTWRAALRHDAARGREHSGLAWRAATAVWGGLIVAVIVWELTALLSSPRFDHPTLSSVTDPVLRYHTARFVAYLLWLALGIDLLRR